MAPEELKIPDCVKSNEEETLMEIARECTILLTHPHPVRYLISDRADWFEDYICNDFGIIQLFYLAEVLNNWK